jgi:hypothetical protein
MKIKKPYPFKEYNQYKWFNSLLDKMEMIRLPEFPDRIFYAIGNDVYMEYRFQDNELYISFNKIWLKIIDFVIPSDNAVIVVDKFILNSIDLNSKIKFFTPIKVVGVSTDEWSYLKELINGN